VFQILSVHCSFSKHITQTRVFVKNKTIAMDRQQKFKAFVFPGIIILLIIIIYSKLSGTENVKSIHLVTLIALGIGIGILLRNIFTDFKRKL